MPSCREILIISVVLYCRKTCNILENLDEDSIKGIRKKIIDLILATDMSQHFESVSKFKLRRHAAGFNFLLDVEDMW